MSRWSSRDVVKTYADGFRAVDGISFRAEPGQVVGLLGPNGAGKTTAIRMLVGLIRPDSGRDLRPRRAGARRGRRAGVGGRVHRGSGLPAPPDRPAEPRARTGRPPAARPRRRTWTRPWRSPGWGPRWTAGSAATATGCGSGSASPRPCSGCPRCWCWTSRPTGSTRRRSRPCARCWPTTRRPGRTVVISSHLLGEVEQTCSHVVVMDQGKIVLDRCGEHADRQRLGDPDRAGRRARTWPRPSGTWASAASRWSGRVSGCGSTAVCRAPTSSASWSRPGYRVESVDGRRQLEEVFLSLVGDGRDGDGRG